MNDKVDFEALIRGSDEIMSPEGVEEKIVYKELLWITLTGGGKFRVYALGSGDRLTSIGVFDDLDKAKEILAQAMMLAAGLMLDPERTIKTLLSGLKRPK